MHCEVHPLDMFLEIRHAAYVPLDLDRLRLANHSGEDCIICFICSLECKVLVQMGPRVAELALVLGGGVIRRRHLPSTGDVIMSSCSAWSSAIVGVDYCCKPIEPSATLTGHQLNPSPRRVTCPADAGVTGRRRGVERSLCYRFRPPDTGTDVPTLRPEAGTGRSSVRNPFA